MSKSWRITAMAVGPLLVWCACATAQPGNAPATAGADGSVRPTTPAPTTPTPTPAPAPTTLAPSATAAPSTPPDTGERAVAEGAAARRIEETRPAIFYLPDKEGKLQPVLDFDYEDFVELYKLKNQLHSRAEPPRYAVQRITAIGSAGEDYAELDVQFRVLLRDDDWVRIPLGLDEVVLRGEAAHQGTGEQFCQREADGYVCWLRGKSDSQHEISLKVLVPLMTGGVQPRLKLSFPRATASELTLTVPLADARGEVSEESTLLPPAPSGSGGTILKAVGLGGNFFLSWNKASPRSAAAPPVLEVSDNVRTRLDSRSITAEAKLSVRSYGTPFDRFTVQLPAGAELVPAVANGYVVTPAGAATDGPAAPRRVLVQLPKKTAGPVEVHLSCRRDYDPANNPAWCELAGFQVLGAARQWGLVVVAAPADWQVLWGSGGDLREIDTFPESMRREDLVAGFEYAAQPYSLTARLIPRKTRVHVDPNYVLFVDRNMLRLEGTLTYTVRGGKVTTLDVAAAGWELDEVGPEKIVAVDGVAKQGEKISIPLHRPVTGSIALQWRAHRPIDAGCKSLRVALPEPQADASDPISLVVVAADSVELTPDERAMKGLTRQQTVALAEGQLLPHQQQEPLGYRGIGGGALFAADFRVQAQRISSETASANGMTVVDRAWIQSRFDGAERQDRAVYQLTTNRKELEVQFPAGAAADQAVVMLDGKRVEKPTILDSRWLIPLPGPRSRRPFVMELLYRFAEPRPSQETLDAEFPRLGPDAWVRRTYWQLVLPANEHVVVSPAGFTGEFAWGWHGYFWGREPLMDQAELEAWSGGPARSPLPDRLSVYLFSALGDVEQAELVTAARTWIVLGASGAALVAGLLLIYVPLSRHPAMLLVLCLGLLAAGWMAPEPTLLVAQAASLGLALSLLSGLLERSTAGRRRRPPPRKEPSSARIEMSSTQPPPRAVIPNGHATTETMPAVSPSSLENVER